MTETENIPWRRLSIEAAAIVGSILLAFAIDAWWEERGLRIEEQQVLQGLREEFLSGRNVLSAHLSEHLTDLQVLEDFLVAAEDGNVEEAGRIVDTAVVVLLSPMSSDLGSGTLAALLSSGRIEILTDATLRAKLASWEGVIGEVWDDQALNAKSVFEIHIPYFLAENIPAGAAMHRWYDDWALPRKSLSDDPDMIRRLMRDERLRTMIELQYGYKRHTTDEFEIAIDAVDAILAEIELSIH
jgi:hypothetical protein